jgi:hypothetical protein
VRRLSLGLLLLLPLLASLAFTATPAAAKVLSLNQLKAQLRSAKASRDRAAERLATCTALVLYAHDLQTLQASSGDAQATTDSGATTTDAASVDVADPLQAAKTELAATLLADNVVTQVEVDGLVASETQARKAAATWAAKVKRLNRLVQRRLQIIRWNRNGNWTPLIKIAAKRYGISAAGLKRLMLLESGGNRYAGSTYKGLFQYYPSTWRGTWNPWRAASIYNGWAQIRATAYAIRRGHGPSQWPNTYWRAF